MTNILSLFTMPEDLEYITLEDNEDGTLIEGTHNLRNGEVVTIMVSTETDSTQTWLVSVGYRFDKFDTKSEFMQFWFDLQKGKIDIHE